MATLLEAGALAGVTRERLFGVRPPPSEPATKNHTAATRQAVAAAVAAHDAWRLVTASVQR